ncbi:NAD(P)/FAD-dependent oxidoreductase [Membranihabitans maritimus]|uniref:NAD(P)/FAD-dependent oxidoreductase n=1 Tax=Membranihabitans maritimus TaxID=2904244 RepID=UPI001F241071|nr:NAD(P)/FAD-dependent oxidoreductase [Membranihabitans maritimus]
MSEVGKKRIVILGAGFAGLKLARELKQSDNKIFLIDRHNYHQFQPLMYQVATSRLEPSSISFPLRKVFQHEKNVHVRLATVEGIDTYSKMVYTNNFDIKYDKLIIAIGCTTNYFGNERLKEYAMPMKSVTESMALRNRILLTFEKALYTPEKDLKAMMNFVIVGGGPTGVELAGAIAEMKKFILPKDYPDMDFSNLNIFLIEGTDATLISMSENAQKFSRKYLEELGVIVKTNTLVSDYDGDVVTFQDGGKIETKNVVWAAGVKGNLLDGLKGDYLVRGNRLKVDRFNEIEGLEDVYAIGDIAYMETEKYPRGHPQLANVAINQAKNLAQNIIKGNDNKDKWTPFEYIDKGSMATVGKKRAVVDLPNYKFQGWFAWITWMAVHFWLILSVKNKLVIFINWMMSYFNNDSTLRIILRAKKSKTSDKSMTMKT